MIRKYDPIGKFHYMEEGEVQLTPDQRLNILKDDLTAIRLPIFCIMTPSSIYSIFMITNRGIWRYLFIQTGIASLLYILFLWKKYRIRKIEKYLIVRNIMND